QFRKTQAEIAQAEKLIRVRGRDFGDEPFGRATRIEELDNGNVVGVADERCLSIGAQPCEDAVGHDDYDAPPAPDTSAAAKGSTRLWIGCARPIHRSGRIQRTQSAKLGICPKSSRTCCSPMSRTGTIRPVAIVTVAPKNRSNMKMPSA